jgi:hypothetical protein
MMRLRGPELGKFARTLGLLAIVWIILIIAPDIAVFMDVVVTLSFLGADLFLMGFIVGLCMLPWGVISEWFEGLLHRLDPYFFVPTANQARACPAIIANVIPGFLSLVLAYGTFQALMGRGTRPHV